MQIVRPEIYPRLLSRRAMIRRCRDTNAAEDVGLSDLERYAAGESWMNDFGDPHSMVSASIDLTSVAYAIGYIATADLLEGDQFQWLNGWKKFVAYRYWAARFGVRNHIAAKEKFLRGERKQELRSLRLHDLGAVAGNMLALGWLDWVDDLCQRANLALKEDWFYDGDCGMIKARTQHFVFNLINSWQGRALCELPCTRDEPIFNEILAHWRDPDAHVLTVPLLAALDRHTHQTRWNKAGKEYFDCNNLTEIYNPFEVLSVLRLRQTLGLPNPDLSEHPLMQIALAWELLPVQPVYTDELLEGIIARARTEYPDL